MSNNCAMVAKIERVEPIEKADRVHVAFVFGEPVIVAKGWGVGKIGLFFPPDTQLSESFCKHNNLYRDSSLNLDKTKSGFFENNRKVRAQPFLGVKSCGFFCELSALAWATDEWETLELNKTFESINGHNIATKFISEETKKQIQKNQSSGGNKQKVKMVPFFKEHVDTDQFSYNSRFIQKGAVISIQAKAHGTSFRCANTKVTIPLSPLKARMNAIAEKIGLPLFFKTWEWDFVIGTRRVLLKNNDQDKNGFHGSEAYRFAVAEKIKPYLQKGMAVYGEIVGFVNGSPIMGTHDVTKLKSPTYVEKYGKSMTYRYNNAGTYSFFIYRVTMMNDEGTEIDLTQQQVVAWCNNNGLEPALDVCESFVYDGDEAALCEKVKLLTERPDLLTQDFRDPTHISEGVIIRCDFGNLRPKFYKSKSTAFRIMEGIFKESNVDVEDAS